MKILPSIEMLKECFDYSPESGLLTWKARPREHFKDDRGWKNFNKQRAGNPAGMASKMGYVKIEIGGGAFCAHRLAWAIHHGADPVGFIDHANRDRADNRIANLRLATPTENARNINLRSNNTSGASGVCWHKPTRKWNAQISTGVKKLSLGYFHTKEAAITARKKAEVEHFKQFAPSH